MSNAKYLLLASAINNMAHVEEQTRVQNARIHEETLRQNEELADKEIRARNRVNISLDEYNAMNEHIDQLRRDNDRMRSILDKFNIPYELPIDPSTFEIITCEDRCRFKTKYSIHFDVDYTGRF